MTRIFRAFLFFSLILSACSPSGLSPESDSRPDFSSPATDSPPELVTTVPTPHIEQPPGVAITDSPSYPEGCGYQWAYQDLPELSGRLLLSIQQLQPEAQASAFAFGENCTGQDGVTVQRFIPMETDFNVTLQVADLSNEAELGQWIVEIMQVIQAIPADEVIGPRPGRVTLIFQADGEQEAVNFYIDQYRSLSSGSSPEEIYRALQTSP